MTPILWEQQYRPAATIAVRRTLIGALRRLTAAIWALTFVLALLAYGFWGAR
jgi:hypothetical protein